MELYDDPLIYKLAKALGFTWKSWDRKSNFSNRIQEVVSMVYEKFGVKLHKDSIRHWMAKSGHRDPDPELLTMVIDVLQNPNDMIMDAPAISLKHLSPGKREIISKIFQITGEKELQKILSYVNDQIDIQNLKKQKPAETTINSNGI